MYLKSGKRKTTLTVFTGLLMHSGYLAATSLDNDRITLDKPVKEQKDSGKKRLKNEDESLLDKAEVNPTNLDTMEVIAPAAERLKQQPGASLITQE